MFELKFETDNAAFDSNDMTECARILRLVAARLDDGAEQGVVHDFNGNSVGAWRLTEEST